MSVTVRLDPDHVDAGRLGAATDLAGELGTDVTLFASDGAVHVSHVVNDAELGVGVRADGYMSLSRFSTPGSPQRRTITAFDRDTALRFLRTGDLRMLDDDEPVDTGLVDDD